MIPGGIYKIPCDTKETQRIWGVGDVHMGARGCHIKMLDKTITNIKNDTNAYWFGMGDMGDFHDLKHRHFTPRDIDPSITVADMGDFGHTMQKMLLAKFLPIKTKCLGMLMGNHEYNYMVHKNDDGWHQRFCDNMGVPNLGYTAIVKIVFQDKNSAYKAKKGITKYKKEYSYSIFLVHGAGSAASATGKKNRLIKYMNNVCTIADIYMMGHVHVLDQHIDVKLHVSPDFKDIIEHCRLGVITGTYLKTYTNGSLPSYGEKNGYDPTALGSPAITIVPETGRIGVENDLKKQL